MSVSYHGELPRKHHVRSDFHREYERRFLLFATSPTDTPTQAEAALLSAIGVTKGVVHPENSLAFCTELEPSQTEDRLGFLITAKYSTAQDDSPASPELRPTTFDWSTEWVERGEGKDLDGNDITNSAQQSFDPPASRRVPVRVCKATCTRTTLSHLNDYDPYIDHVNSVGFVVDGLTCPPGSLLCDSIDVGSQDEGGTIFRRFSYTFKFRKDLYTTSTTTLTADAAAGTNVVVSVASTSGIVVGSEIEIGSDLCAVLAVGVGTVTVDLLTATHLSGATLTIRAYNPWQYMPLDMGYDEWDGEKNTPILMANGQPVSQPILLDGSGSRLATWADQAPVRLLFRLRDSADFNGITFP